MVNESREKSFSLRKLFSDLRKAKKTTTKPKKKIAVCQYNTLLLLLLSVWLAGCLSIVPTNALIHEELTSANTYRTLLYVRIRTGVPTNGTEPSWYEQIMNLRHLHSLTHTWNSKQKKKREGSFPPWYVCKNFFFLIFWIAYVRLSATLNPCSYVYIYVYLFICLVCDEGEFVTKSSSLSSSSPYMYSCSQIHSHSFTNTWVLVKIFKIFFAFLLKFK